MKPFFALLLAFCLSAAVVRAEDPSWQYEGFTVNGPVGSLDGSMQRALTEQIDMVVAVGFNAEFLGFFRSVPISIVPSAGILSGNPGLYLKRERAVRLTSRMVSIGHKPVLLHELLHAYHDQKMTAGVRNPEVLKLYENARQSGAFKSTSHMMENAGEFFACAGTTFLFGVTAQEPFRRKNLEHQTKLLEFMRNLFGPSCGSYEGSLSNHVAGSPTESARPRD